MGGGGRGEGGGGVSPERRWQDQVRLDQLIQFNVHSDHGEGSLSPGQLAILTPTYI